MSATLAAGLAGLGSLASTGASALASSNLNKQNRQWNERMYARQRSDALSDWNRQANWDSFENQLKRGRKAGVSDAFTLTGSAGVNAPSTNSSSPGDAPTGALPDFSGMANAGSSAVAAANATAQQRANTAVSVQDALLRQQQVLTEQLSQSEKQLNIALRTGDLRLFMDTYEEQATARRLANQATIAGIENTLMGAGVSREQILNLRNERSIASRRDARDSVRLWNELRRTSIDQQNANTNAAGVSVQRDRLNLESPYFGSGPRPWYVNPLMHGVGLDPTNPLPQVWDFFTGGRNRNMPLDSLIGTDSYKGSFKPYIPRKTRPDTRIFKR